MSRSSSLLPVWWRTSRYWDCLRPPLIANIAPSHPHYGVRLSKVSVHCSSTTKSQYCHPNKNLMRQSRIVMGVRSAATGVTVVEFRGDGWKFISISVYLCHVRPFHRLSPPPPTKNAPTLPIFIRLFRPELVHLQVGCPCRRAINGAQRTVPLPSHHFHSSTLYTC